MEAPYEPNIFKDMEREQLRDLMEGVTIVTTVDIMIDTAKMNPLEM